MQPIAQTFNTREEFFNVYWFQPTDMVTLLNPQDKDYPFMVEGRHFIIKAGEQIQMPGTVANVYLSQMTRILAQDENKMEFLSDYNLMKQYYDRLMVDVKSMLQEVNNEPAYLSQVPQSMRAEAPEVAPWQRVATDAPKTEVEENTSGMKNKLDKTDLKEFKEETKEFELSGDKFKKITTKTGKSMYYKNGVLTSEVEYAKAASML